MNILRVKITRLAVNGKLYITLNRGALKLVRIN